MRDGIDQKWPQSLGDFSMKAGSWENDWREGQWVIKSNLSRCIFSLKGIRWSHVQLWYIRTATQTHFPLTKLHWFDSFFFPPLACSWEVTKDETWLPAVPKSSHTYAPPKALNCLCLQYMSGFMCVQRVGVWNWAFVWDTMPNVLERMSRTLGCDVLPCWPEPSCGGDLTGCHLVN